MTVDGSWNRLGLASMAMSTVFIIIYHGQLIENKPDDTEKTK